MVRGEHSTHSVLSWFGSTTFPFLLRSTYSILASLVGSSHFLSVFKVVCLGSFLIQTISPITLSSKFPFFFTYPNAISQPIESGTVSVHLIESSDWHSLKDIYIVRFLNLIWPSSVQLPSKFLITLIVYV